MNSLFPKDEVILSKTYLKFFKLTRLNLLSFYISFTLIAISMALSAVSERQFHKLRSKKNSPEKNSSLLSMLTFWWINTLIRTGYKRDLTRDDLWEIDSAEKSEHVTKKLEQVWFPKANK